MPDLPNPTAARLPRARWLDSRLLVGVLLVVVSMTVGARVLARADDTVAVWSARVDLAAGSLLHGSDVSVAHVHLVRGTGEYLSATSSLEGRALAREVGAGELLAASALAVPGERDRVEVSVPVRSGHYPLDLARNDRVDVYVTPEATRSSTEPQQPRRVLALATVAQVRGADGRLGVSTSGDSGIVLSLPRSSVAQAAAAAPVDVDAATEAGVVRPSADPVLSLVAAFGQGSVDVVRVAAR